MDFCRWCIYKGMSSSRRRRRCRPIVDFLLFNRRWERVRERKKERKEEASSTAGDLLFRFLILLLRLFIILFSWSCSSLCRINYSFFPVSFPQHDFFTTMSFRDKSAFSLYATPDLESLFNLLGVVMSLIASRDIQRPMTTYFPRKWHYLPACFTLVPQFTSSSQK